MKIAILTLFAFTSYFIQAQTNVSLTLHHKLGTNNFQFNTAAGNNLGHSFKLSRMEYYLTKFSITHDGGQVTEISADTVTLVNAGTGTTTIPLGLLNVTNIEGVKFHVGVHTPINHEDPALLPADHPLAPKSPSMHWGWTSGYRFIALEGLSGTNLNQSLELHGLGDVNYFETTVSAIGVSEAGGLVVHVDADYQRGLEDISINSGLIVHGETLEAATMIANFRDYVFSANALSVSIQENEIVAFDVFPNPAKGSILVSFPGNYTNARIVVTDFTGRLIEFTEVTNAIETTLNLPVSGIYFVNLYSGEQMIASEKVVNY
ncbi:MAG: hypothetical protein RL265_38 [Bacteroidota bacterium]|jgi:hypothetical protein|nr:T9SS type A sorting domain-containing protein [Crocinitomicaceae bacterium]